jgi:putative photosynthetic complex assembly protein
MIPPVAAFLVAFVTVIGIHVHQLDKAEHGTAQVTASALRSRDLRFIDAGDGMTAYGGHVAVYDAATGAAFPPLRQSDGFIRAVLNSLNFERTRRAIDAAPPVFRLTYWSDRKITLRDLATGKQVGLGQFGAANEAVFMRFLANTEARS